MPPPAPDEGPGGGTPRAAAPRRWRLPRTALAPLAGLLLLTAEAPAAGVTLNLEGADIAALIATVSEITGKNFIVDPRVKGKVTVISSRPMEQEEIYQVFLSILQTHGFAAIPSGPVVKIIPDANARQTGPEPIPLEEGLENDALTTKVIPLANVSAAQLVPLLRPLVPQEGHLAAYPATNVLIITDRASNLRRLAEIVRRVDQASDSGVEVIRLRNASAPEVVKILTALEQKPQAGEAPRQPAVISADERTNSVLLSADPTTRLRLRTLISHLDTPLEAAGNTHVLYLRYANAKDLVSVLTGVGEKAGGGEARALAPGQPAGGGALARDVSVVAEERTNSLVVTAPPSAMETLRSVVRQLDIRRAQVLVEAIIAEVSPAKSAELGIQWQTDLGISTGTFGRFSRSKGDFSIGEGGDDDDATDPIDSLRGGLFVGYLEGGNLRALLRAVAKDGNSNVLSTPSLVTMDNEEAEIIVGQNVPFVTGQYSSTTSTVDQPFQTIQRQDVGIILKVKPQINEGDAVRLDIKQEVSSVIEGASSASDLVTSKRSIATKVIVDDGQVLVLGGLIEDKLRESVTKVPFLGDIPLLGNLFKDRTLASDKINLMVFLKPTILRDREDGNLVSRAKYTHLREQQAANPPEAMWLIPRAKREVLPPWPEDQPAPTAERPPAEAPVETAAEAKPSSPFPWDPGW
jgi:general secretion pathway protein D